MKNIILQQKEERDGMLAKKYVTRSILHLAQTYLESPLIKLITGPRRAGKSVLAIEMLRGKNFAYLNFDDDMLLKSFNEDEVIKYLYETYPDFEFLLLDEIQNLNNWDIWVNKLQRRGINLIITGSNARLLSREMATVLTGRYLQIEVLPFSFQEMLGTEFPNNLTPKQSGDVLAQLQDYLIYGGYPETIVFRDITKNYLSSLFDSILLKDITKRFNVRKTDDLYNLATYLLTNYCNPLSLGDVTEDLKLASKATAQKFAGYLTETYIIFYLPRYYNKPKEILRSPQKSYIVDNGFIYAHSIESSPNRGRLLENLVFVELLRKGYKPGLTLFYYKSKNNREVDFLCKNSSQITQLIQVSYDISASRTLKRELEGLGQAASETHCSNTLLITYDKNDYINGINIVSFAKWVIDNPSNDV